MDTQSILDDIRADIIKDKVCPELASSATQLVFGDGDSGAEILFIGEAPGRQEDEQGLPFVGASGKFLDKMLDTIGLNRQQVYITNIVKYRPPNNRDPSPEEKKAFVPYLMRQIQAINPLLIVCLGRHSGMLFIPELKISLDHGTPKKIKLIMPSDEALGSEQVSGVRGANEQSTEAYVQYADGVAEFATQQTATKHDGQTSLAGRTAVLSLVILPLYHPAAALYNGSQRQTLMEDFANIPNILNKLRKIN